MMCKAIQTFALARLIEQMSRAIHSKGHSHGLFPAQWTALRYFATADPLRSNSSALAAYQGMAFGPVSRTVRTLVTKGLLRKGPTRGMGRFECLEVTEMGRDLLTQDPLKEILAALDGLSDEDKQVLAVALEAVLLRLQRVDGDEGLLP